MVDCNPLSPLLRFVLDLSYKLFLCCYAAVDKISTDTSRRAVRLSVIAELLVLFCELFVVLLAQTAEERRGRNRRGTGSFVELGIQRVFYTLLATSKCVLNISREDSRQAAAQCNLDAQQPELVRKFLLYQVTVQWLECLGTQGSGAPAPLIIGKQRFRA